MTSLRYHHIGAINDLFHNYNEWAKSQNDLSQVKISDLWRQPNEVDQFLEYWMAESIFMFETITRLKKRSVNFTIQELKDYIGPQGEYIKGFVQERAQRYREFLCCDPTTLITLTYHDDGLCQSCQLKTPVGAGEHCQSYRFSSQDYIWEQSVAYLAEDDPVMKYLPNEIKGPEYQISAHTLRDERFVQIVSGIVDEHMSDPEVWTQLQKLGVLQESGVPYMHHSLTREYLARRARGEKI